MFAFFSKKSLKITLEANLLLGFAQSNSQRFFSRKLTGNGTSGMTCWKCDGREWTIWVHGYGSDSCGTSGLGVERNFFSRKGHIHAVKRHYECAITYLAWWMRQRQMSIVWCHTTCPGIVLTVRRQRSVLLRAVSKHIINIMDSQLTLSTS